MNINPDTLIFPYIFIPLLICAARVIDVTLGTLRIIFVSRGFVKLAPIVGFFEILIWLLAIGQVMNNLTNIYNYLAYALGFAIGNYIGMIIERKLSLGVVIVQVITQSDASPLIALLHEKGYGITTSDATGISGPVHIIFSVIKRSKLNEIVEIIKKYNPKAFYLVSDIRAVSEGLYPLRYVSGSKRFSFRKAVKKKEVDRLNFESKNETKIFTSQLFTILQFSIKYKISFPLVWTIERDFVACTKFLVGTFFQAQLSRSQEGKCVITNHWIALPRLVMSSTVKSSALGNIHR